MRASFRHSEEYRRIIKRLEELEEKIVKLEKRKKK